MMPRLHMHGALWRRGLVEVQLGPGLLGLIRGVRVDGSSGHPYAGIKFVAFAFGEVGAL